MHAAIWLAILHHASWRAVCQFACPLALSPSRSLVPSLAFSLAFSPALSLALPPAQSLARSYALSPALSPALTLALFLALLLVFSLALLPVLALSLACCLARLVLALSLVLSLALSLAPRSLTCSPARSCFTACSLFCTFSFVPICQISPSLRLSRCLVVRFMLLSSVSHFSISRQNTHHTSTHQLLVVMIGNLKRLERACVCVCVCLCDSTGGVSGGSTRVGCRKRR